MYMYMYMYPLKNASYMCMFNSVVLSVVCFVIRRIRSSTGTTLVMSKLQLNYRKRR